MGVISDQRRSIASGSSASALLRWFMPVSITPGLIALQRMFRRAYSIATTRVIDMTAPFDAA